MLVHAVVCVLALVAGLSVGAEWPGACAKDRHCEPHGAVCGDGSLGGPRECVCPYGWDKRWLHCNAAVPPDAERRTIDVVTAPRVFDDWMCSGASKWKWCASESNGVILAVHGAEHIEALFEYGDTSVVQWRCSDRSRLDPARGAQAFRDWCSQPRRDGAGPTHAPCDASLACPAGEECFADATTGRSECHCAPGRVRAGGEGPCVPHGEEVAYTDYDGAIVTYNRHDTRSLRVVHKSGEVSMAPNAAPEWHDTPRASRDPAAHLWAVQDGVPRPATDSPAIPRAAWKAEEAACPGNRRFGADCEFSAEECSVSRCSGRGACSGTLVGCACRPPFSGIACEQWDCGLRGSLSGTGPTAACACAPGRTGPTCRTNACGVAGWWNGTGCACRGKGRVNRETGQCDASACGDPNAWLLADGSCGCPAGIHPASGLCKAAPQIRRERRVSSFIAAPKQEGVEPERWATDLFIAVTAILLITLGCCMECIAMQPRIRLKNV